MANGDCVVSCNALPEESAYQRDKAVGTWALASYDPASVLFAGRSGRNVSLE